MSVGLVNRLLKGEALHAADKTRIAVTNFNLSYLVVGVAIKRGFFKDERLDVEVIRMNTPNTVTAMITGDVGYTMLFGSGDPRRSARHAAARYG